MKPRALYVTTRLSPPHGGDVIYSRGLLREFSKVFDLDVLCLNGEIPSSLQGQIRRSFCGSTSSHLERLRQRLPLSMFIHPNVAIEATTVLHPSDYDVVVVDHLRVYRIFRRYYGSAALVYASHNIEDSNQLDAFHSDKSIVRKIGSLFRWIGARRNERSALHQAVAVSAISNEDAVRLSARRKGRSDVRVIGPAPPAMTTIAKPISERSRMLFFGSLSWYPNVLAANRLVNRVFPGIHDLLPSVTLTIAGRSPRRNLFSLERSGIRVLANPESAEQVYDEHDLLIVPSLRGTGAKVKIVDALSSGLPVVAERGAARGVSELLHPRMTYGSDAEAAEVLVAALTDKDLRQSAIEHAARAVESMTSRNRTSVDEIARLAMSHIGATRD